MSRRSLADRLDKETLERLHHKEGLSAFEIALRFRSFTSNVLALMQRYGIAHHSPGE